MNKTPTTLIIMDGFGLRQETEGNAIQAAATPRLDQFFQEFAHTTLRATRAPYRLRMVARMLVQTSPACWAVAVLPVPMAQMGS